MLTNIHSDIIALAQARQNFERAKAELQEFCETNPAYLSLVAKIETATLLKTETETAVRESAIILYNAGNDQPHDAVKIKQHQYLVIDDDDQALAYCRTELPQALKVDTTIFNKIMAAMPADRRPGFVTTKHEPRTYIARDLSQYMEG
jgi:hypothetical protein